jgi:hypothetical protein
MESKRLFGSFAARFQAAAGIRPRFFIKTRVGNSDMIPVGGRYDSTSALVKPYDVLVRDEPAFQNKAPRTSFHTECPPKTQKLIFRRPG